jgi:D-serine deaminase-like pyridoxal phosphate-dependent protein
MPRPCLDGYSVEKLDLLSTPRLLVFRACFERNVARMRGYLEDIVPGSGFRHLCPHVKTHKSEWVARRLMEHGVTKLKCTPNELDMCLEVGPADLFVGYPLVAHEAERVAESAARHPRTRITAQIASIVHAERLAAAARRHDVEIDCLIDLDVGHHRTGIAPGLAPGLAREVLATPRLGTLRIAGLHAYGGHNSSADASERAACSERAMREVVECARALAAAGADVDWIAVSGTPSFATDLRELIVRHRVDAHVDVSPGTWVYWDTNYDAKMPGAFDFAALVLAQVMDRPGENLATLNLGHKRWAIDQGPVTLFSVPGLEVVGTSEEHTVLRVPQGTRLAIEDRVLIAPRHVCSTVNLWESFTLVGDGGRLEVTSLPVSGRNR